MNIKFENLEGTIFYDESKQLYDFPYLLKFNNETFEISFIFHKDDYINQEEMLIERDHEISKEILNNHFLRQFEAIQEICLDENDNKSMNEELVNEVNERLDLLYYLFVLISKLNKKKGENEVVETIWSLYDELLEMFVLLEDLYSGIRKTEIIQRKKRFVDLEGK
jgi:hypothetical protein